MSHNETVPCLRECSRLVGSGFLCVYGTSSTSVLRGLAGGFYAGLIDRAEDLFRLQDQNEVIVNIDMDGFASHETGHQVLKTMAGAKIVDPRAQISVPAM